jgi:hypothetical protein
MYGSSAKAEQELLLREKRMKNILIHPLRAEERDRYMRQWHDVESRFVDDPTGSTARSDQLVIEVMRAQGYPIADFEKRLRIYL